MDALRKLWSAVVDKVGALQWEWLMPPKLDRSHHALICQVLSRGNFVILTRRRAHMSTYLVGIGHWFLTGRWGYWSHVCMNVEPDDLDLASSVRIVEAVGAGVRISGFYDVFDCDSVKILRPLIHEGFEWEDVIAQALKSVGRPYDDFFDLSDAEAQSCVEVFWQAMKEDTRFRERFHGLVAQVEREKNLTPSMFEECGSFETMLEIRNGKLVNHVRSV